MLDASDFILNNPAWENISADQAGEHKDELAIGCMLMAEAACAGIPKKIEDLRHGNDFSG